MTRARACWGTGTWANPSCPGERLHSVLEPSGGSAPARAGGLGPLTGRARWPTVRRACALGYPLGSAGVDGRLAQRPQGDPHVPDRLPPEPVRGVVGQTEAQMAMIMLAQYPRTGVTDSGPTLPGTPESQEDHMAEQNEAFQLPRHPGTTNRSVTVEDVDGKTYHVRPCCRRSSSWDSLRPWIGPWVRTRSGARSTLKAVSGESSGDHVMALIKFARLIVAAGNRRHGARRARRAGQDRSPGPAPTRQRALPEIQEVLRMLLLSFPACSAARLPPSRQAIPPRLRRTTSTGRRPVEAALNLQDGIALLLANGHGYNEILSWTWEQIVRGPGRVGGRGTTAWTRWSGRWPRSWALRSGRHARVTSATEAVLEDQRARRAQNDLSVKRSMEEQALATIQGMGFEIETTGPAREGKALDGNLPSWRCPVSILPPVPEVLANLRAIRAGKPWPHLTLPCRSSRPSRPTSS